MRRSGMIAVILVVGWGTGFTMGHLGHRAPSGLSPQPPTIQQVQELAGLVTTRVQVADVQETDVSGYTGGMRVLMLVRGDFLLAVDLSDVRLEAVNVSSRTAVLWLPQPSVSSPRVDHARTKLFEVASQGLWTLVPSDAGRAKIIQRAYEQAQRAVAGRASEPDLQEQSRRQAEHALQTFFAALGWKLAVRWRA